MFKTSCGVISTDQSMYSISYLKNPKTLNIKLFQNKPTYRSDLDDLLLTKGRRTRANKIQLSVHLGTLLFIKLVGFNATDIKVYSVRLIMIMHLKIRYHF